MTQELTKDIIQWDVKSWAEALKYWEKAVDWNVPKNGLELGGREGGLSLWLALKGIPTVCSDLKGVQQTAEPLHKRYEVTSLVTYQDIDATNIPYENHFDLIVLKSVIGGIGKNDKFDMQEKVLREIHKALKPGGKLLFAENLSASPLHQRLRKRYVNWGKAWRYLALSEMKALLSGFSYYEIKTTGVLGTLGRTEGQRNFLSTLDKLLFNHICPKSWKYISYGIAEK